MAKRVKEAHAFDDRGVPTVMRVGTLVADDDPRIKGRECYYEDADESAARQTVSAVETASAAPGEKRSRPQKLPTTAA